MRIFLLESFADGIVLLFAKAIVGILYFFAGLMRILSFEKTAKRIRKVAEWIDEEVRL